MCNVQFKTKIAKLTYQIYIQNIYYQISRKFSNFSIFDRLSIFKSWRHFDSKKSFYILNAGIVRENVEYLVSICILVCTKQNIYKKNNIFCSPEFRNIRIYDNFSQYAWCIKRFPRKCQQIEIHKI